MKEDNHWIKYAEQIGLNPKGMIDLNASVKRLPLEQARQKLAAYTEMFDRALPQGLLAEKRAQVRLNMVRWAVIDITCGRDMRVA